MVLPVDRRLAGEPLTFNEQLRDAFVRHQIGLLRFSGHLRNETWKLLDATEADVRRQIVDRLRRNSPGAITPANLRRAERLLAALRETRVKAWRDVTDMWVEELTALALAEPGFMAGIVSTAIPVEFAFSAVDPDRLRNIVRSHPFLGSTLREWSRDLEQRDVRRMEQQIKIGLVQGETAQQISRRIVGTVSRRGTDGVTQIARRGAAAVTRTAVNSIASRARAEFAELNKDVLPQEVFTATLDSNTTPICRSLDGNVYGVGTGPVLPLHMGERSLYSPVADGEVIGERPIRNFTQRLLLREYTDAQGLDRVTARARLPRGHKGAFDEFARRRMRELTGRVPARTTYTEFLQRQTAEVQDDILGRTRGALFRRGGVTLDRFVDREGDLIPLAELARREGRAFKAAGLDPDEFMPRAA